MCVCVFLWTSLSKRWSIGIQLFLRGNYETLTWKIDSFDFSLTASPLPAHSNGLRQRVENRERVKRNSLKREKRLVQSLWVSMCVWEWWDPLNSRSVYVCDWAEERFSKSVIYSSTSIRMFKPPFHLCLRRLRMDWQEWIICEIERVAIVRCESQFVEN